MQAAVRGSVGIFNRLLELGVDPLAADDVRTLCMCCPHALQLSGCD